MRRVSTFLIIATLAGCGGGSGGSSSGPTPGPGPTPEPPTPPPVTGIAELIWTAPTRNEDGSALTDLAGYKVRYGQSAGGLTQILDVATPATTTTRIDGLATGPWYFTVASYTNTGVESVHAGPVSKAVQ
jgi:hypothetical protein